MHVTITRVAALTVLAASISLAGCKAKERGETADTIGSSGMAMQDSSASGATASSGAAAAPLSDENILALHDAVNVGDSTLAAAALPKLSNADVRSFARMMMGEHHSLHMKGLSVEKAQSVTPQTPAANPFQSAVEAEQTALSSMTKGKSYDSTYVAHEVVIHQAVLEWAQKNMPKNPALQDFVKSAAPVIQKHLDKALDLESKFGGGGMS